MCWRRAELFCRSQQLSRKGLIRILDLARLLDPVAKGEKTSRILEGAQLGNLFFEPSTRSRIARSRFRAVGGNHPRYDGHGDHLTLERRVLAEIPLAS